MERAKACFGVALAVWVGATACTSKDSLIDDGSAGMGAQSAGGSAGKGGSAGAHAGTGASAGTPPSNGGSSVGGGSGTGGSSRGGSGGSAAGAGAGAGGAAVGGGAGGSGGDGASSGAADGGTSGSAVGGTSGASGASGSSGACSDVTTLDECEARTDCHSVFHDPGTCGCGKVGCCAKFSACADGDQADCEGKSLSCGAMTPYCEKPAFVVSFRGACFEGCVQPKDCAATTPT